MAEESPVIIIRKKKGGHGGHHGGAWKVAYADFVTAMMALFIVLWLLSSSNAVKQAVSGYFKDPKGFSERIGSGQGGAGESSMSVGKSDMNKLGDKLKEALSKLPEFAMMKDQVLITVTGEGLRVELLETQRGMFFDSGSAKPSRQGEELLQMLTAELSKLPNDIVLEGHTDSKPFAASGAYGNWELSADRANSARRFMESAGLSPKRVAQIRGFADQQLLKPDQPEHDMNRRVSVIVRYRPDESPPAAPDKHQPEAHQPAGHAPPAAHPAKKSGH